MAKKTMREIKAQTGLAGMKALVPVLGFRKALNQMYRWRL